MTGSYSDKIKALHPSLGALDIAAEIAADADREILTLRALLDGKIRENQRLKGAE